MIKITEQEIEAVSKLEPFQRYQYFIKRVADTEKMYTLADRDGNFAITILEGISVFSIWSSTQFALKCAEDEWSGFIVKEIILEEFEEETVDVIEENGWLLNVFSVKGKSGFVVDINEFARDLSEEMKKYH
jgi:hypothetical protein